MRDIGGAGGLPKLQVKLLVLTHQLQLLGPLSLQLIVGQCNLASHVQIQKRQQTNDHHAGQQHAAGL
jgi:hypothetical protein